MWGRKPKPEPESETPQPLTEAVREARIESAERSGVVVDLRDAERARLELLNEALDPLFKEIPQGVDLIDRGISAGDVPRLWIDVIAHVEMGRDKRLYRLVQDSRYGRATLAESYEVPMMVQAITQYVARRLVERERALAGDAEQGGVVARRAAVHERRRRRWSAIRGFVLGVVLTVAALVVAAMLYTQP